MLTHSKRKFRDIGSAGSSEVMTNTAEHHRIQWCQYRR